MNLLYFKYDMSIIYHFDNFSLPDLRCMLQSCFMRLAFLFISLILVAGFGHAAAPGSPSETSLQEIVALEDQAMKLQFEIASLKKQQAYEQREFIIKTVFAEEKKQSQKGISALWGKFKAKIFKSKPKAVVAPPAVLTQLNSKIKLKEAALTSIEAGLDKAYASLVPSQNKKTKVTASCIQAAVLHTSTQFRRNVGHPLHTTLPGLSSDPDCQGDLVQDRPFFGYAAGAVQANYPLAYTHLHFMARQFQCLSSFELAHTDYAFHQAVQSTLSLLDGMARKKYLEVILNPMLLLYDAGKGQRSAIFQFINEHKDELIAAYTPQSLPATIGIYLVDWTTDSLTHIPLTPADDVPGSTPKVSSAAATDLDWKDFIPGETTIYGEFLEEIQKKHCMKGMEGLAANLGKTMVTGQETNWEQFVENVGDPSMIGNGASPFTHTAAVGQPDLVGICGGTGMGGGGGGGGFQCGLSSGGPGKGDGLPGAPPMAKPCEPKSGFGSPLKPQPKPSMGGSASFAGGDFGGGSAGDQVTQIVTRGSPICSMVPGQGVSADSPEKPETPVKSDPQGDKAKKNTEKGAEEGDKKKDDLADAAGKKDQKAKEDAKAKADKAAKDAKLVDGIKKTVTDGKATFTDNNGNVLTDNSGIPLSDIDCGDCADGTVKANGTTVTNTDGEITIIFDKAAVANGDGASGMSGSDIAQHEWAHAFLAALGVESSKQHEIMHGVGIHYCPLDSEGCSSDCTGGDTVLGLNFDCKEAGEGKKLKDEISSSCPPGSEFCGGLDDKPKLKKPPGEPPGPEIWGPVDIGGGPMDACVVWSRLYEKIGPVGLPGGEGGSGGLPPICGGYGCSGGMDMSNVFTSTGAGVTDPAPELEKAKFPAWSQQEGPLTIQVDKSGKDIPLWLVEEPMQK